MEAWHKFRFVKNGYVISGTAALLLVFVLAGAGIYLWWPRRSSSLKLALSQSASARARRQRSICHKVLGVYASFILVRDCAHRSSTGVDWFQDGIFWITASPRPAKPQSTPMPEKTPPEHGDLLAEIESLVPDRRKRSFVPGQAARPRRESCHRAGRPARQRAYDAVSRAYSGEVLRFTPYAQSSLGHQACLWTLSWHTGMVGGIVRPADHLRRALWR